MVANSAIRFKVRHVSVWARTHVSELHQPEFSELHDAVVRGAGLQEQLGQTHLFPSQQGAHLDSSGVKARALPAPGEVTG